MIPADLRARHMKLRVACQSPDVPLVTEVCGFCNTSWPCDTIQALDHADALQRRLGEAEASKAKLFADMTAREGFLEKERDRALADGAAVRQFLQQAYDFITTVYTDAQVWDETRYKHECDWGEALRQPNPGSALLHELEGLRRRVKELEESYHCYFCNEVIPEERAKIHFNGHEYRLAVAQVGREQAEKQLTALQPLLDAVRKLPKVNGEIHIVGSTRGYEVYDRQVDGSFTVLTTHWKKDEADALAAVLTLRKERP